MADFIIVGGKARKAKGRIGGESGGRSYDRSFERKHLRVMSKQLIAEALEDLRSEELVKSVKAQTRASKPDIVLLKKRSHHDVSSRCPSAPSTLTPRSAFPHNNYNVVVYPDRMRIVSARY